MEKYENFLLRDFYIIRNFCMQYSSIYLYGAGDIGEKILEHLTTMNINISGFLVSDGHRIKPKFHGYKVHEISDITLDDDTGVIISVSKEKHLKIEKILECKKIPKTHIYRQNIYGIDVQAKRDFNTILPLIVNKEEQYFRLFTDLNDIGKKYGTDKCSCFHNYLNKYEFFLRTFKNKSFHLLELGVFDGNSLRMWDEYFPKAQIWGVDIDPQCKKHSNENIHVIITDLSKSSNILLIKKQIVGNLSLIIDDASHLWSHQIKALFSLFPCLIHGGIYIIEDLETSFRSYDMMGYNDASVSAYEVCSAIAEVVTGQEYLLEKGKSHAILDLSQYIEAIGREIDMISFIHGSCIMVKK